MSRRRATLALTAGLGLTGLLVGLPTSNAAVTPSSHLLRPLQGADSGDFPGAEKPEGDADRRGAALAPLASASAALSALGGDLHVSWTQYGTPLTLTREGDFLASGYSGTPASMARSFLKAHPGLFGLNGAAIDALELVSAEPLPQSTTAFVVLLRQTMKGLPLAEDGLVAVGMDTSGHIAYVTSSVVPTAVLGSLSSTTPKISAAQAVLNAGKDVGVDKLGLGDLRAGKVDGAGFQTFAAIGLHQLQRARLRVLPTTSLGARLVWETNITDVAGGRALAATGFVDALSGKVLLRRDAVDTLAEGTASSPSMRSVSTAAAQPTGGSFNGAYTATGCGPLHPLTVPAGSVTIAAVVSAVVPVNDIVVKVLRKGVEIAAVDNGVAEEVVSVTLAPAATTADTFAIKVCPLGAGSVSPVQTPPYDYAGSYVVTDQGAPQPPGLPGPLTDGSQFGPATWHAFGNTPPLGGGKAPDNRYKACSGKPGDPNPLSQDVTGCDFLYNDGSPLPYDANPLTGSPTFTTLGNNALSSDARASSSLTPGGPFLPPLSPTRDYNPAFTDVWHTSSCDPASIIGPDMSDVQAAIVNLFVGHNRAHDFAYRLGLTEPRGALQTSNFGKGGAELDPELGNAQNAALSQEAFAAVNTAGGPAGEASPLTGRNNANQITLQDGVPGITNQYLFQPIPTFHGPCSDGDFDAGVFIHEYTHAISNRLIAGPDTGLSGQQGGSMGESWSDLVATEYLNAYGLAGKNGSSGTALGAYVTGNPVRGIRDYNVDPKLTPLNYSDFGFDTTGPEVHADGEIWNAVQMDVRQTLINKYNATYPYSNQVLQKACALGRTTTGAPGPAFNRCPGNRRYITYLFDAMIGQANGSPSMVDMKNVELASILLRDKADYSTVAEAFARRGLGAKALSRTTADTDPTPSFEAPKSTGNADVTFKLVDATTGNPVKGSVFVGMYHARCTPIATTLGGTKAAGPTTKIFEGSYVFTVQAKGYGIQRFTVALTPGTTTQTFRLAQNIASKAYGPSITGNAGAARLGLVIDDDENTNGSFAGKPVAGRQITVKFAKRQQTFDRVGVSALHHVALALPEGGKELEGRFLGIRAFDLQISTNGGSTFTTIYKSPDNFFPSVRPRPVAPDLIEREVKLAKPVTADAIRLVVRSNACTGQKDFNDDPTADALQPSSCLTVPDYPTSVTVTELEVFRAAGAVAPVVVPPTVVPPVVAPRLPATGGHTGLALEALGLLSLAGVALAVRRKLV